MNENRIINGDCLPELRKLSDESVNSCVTSPPYYALRDYGEEAQIGRENTPEEYIHRLVLVFREVRRILTRDGTLWLNIGDTYCGTGNKKNHARRVNDCKQKDMIGIPWMLAFALRADGWYLRSDIIWCKGNPMPESVRDRPSRCYEHIFLLTKSKKYHYDKLATAEPIAASTVKWLKNAYKSGKYADGVPGQSAQTIKRARPGISDADITPVRNARDVWHINTVPYKGGHFAAFPPKLAEKCILAGCPRGGVVLDPFFGSGTTGLAAITNARHYIGIELNTAYCELAKKRISSFRPE